MDSKLEIKNLQRQIKADLKGVGWSVRYFASKYITDTDDYDTPETDVKRFQESVKKQLSRSTTDIKLLEKYQNYIRQSDEFQKLVDEDLVESVQPLTGFIADYEALIKDEQDKDKRKVLEVAAAHALSVGSAWEFHIIKIDADDTYDTRYIALWEGDIGHNGGSGCWGSAMCEVSESRWGRMFVRRFEPSFKTGLKTISEIIKFSEGKIILRGLDYGSNDLNNFPSQEYEVELTEQSGTWNLINKTLISQNRV
ncbi:TPA: hypothetical protein N2785_004470 [Vibrio parahaemolyticus]|nr:hypothetical protein [Vibrio parahaemolyticus]